MNSFADIIAAISTPPGKGGVAITRISGAGAVKLAEKMFRPASGKRLGEHPPRMQVYGHVISDEGSRLDDGMACFFKEGASFTGEETVEIASHGGVLVSSMVLERALSCGARYAEAGEFTRRAFVNGRISLSDAEAIGMLLEAKSREQVTLASEDSRDALGTALSDIEAGLVEILSSIYARIDYPDEDLGDFSDGEISQRLDALEEKVKALLATYKTGKAIAEGIKTVICGKPNAGKSTLYNAILGEDAAIVTDIKGTTTDVLEKEALLGRVTLRLSDTAGIRSKADAGVIERIGIERTQAALNAAELIIAVFDLSEKFDDEDEHVLRETEGKDAAKIAVLSKADVQTVKFDTSKIEGKFDTVLTLSAKKSATDARSMLSGAVESAFTDEKIKLGESAVISSARQNAALSTALGHLQSAKDALSHGCTADMVSSDVERALRSLSETDGREVSETVTNDIFSKFCVGK
ncbi:MAG: tRNA uridine-5-carboxymethylaminomethyl(34) synthesis GTPase MnmE [Clostridia bacterium]|nr:tRNA uridine-5-carboxymethylaminomethyl(34) synthesis GTPase MnmE [Clostridia bacterium]